MSALPVSELFYRGQEQYLAGDLEAARLFFLAAIETDRRDISSLMGLTSTCVGLNLFDAAVAYARQVINLDANDAGGWNNYANALMNAQRYEEATDALSKALLLDQNSSMIWHNLALLQYRLGAYARAEFAIDQCLKFSPDGGSAGAHCDKAHILLARPQTFERGIEGWDWRFKPGPTSLTFLGDPAKLWDGQPRPNSSLLVWREQGLGDTLMCLRFLPELVAKFRHVTLAVEPSIAPLVAEQGWKVATLDIADTPAEIDKYDYHVPLFDVLKYVENISAAPYLTAGVPIPTRSDRLRVGVCWASGFRPGMIQRKIEFKQILDYLGGLPSVELVSLQRSEVDEVAPTEYGAEGLINISHIANCNNWYETARLIKYLDVVVSVDTAVAHLAAALGKPTLMLSQFVRCWRWWDANQEHGGPWYSTMKFYRQQKPRDWTDPLGRACAFILNRTLGARNAATRW